MHQVQEAFGDKAFEALRTLCLRNPEIFTLQPFWYFAALSSLTEAQHQNANSVFGSPTSISPQTQQRMLVLHGAADVAIPGPAARILVNELGLENVEPLMYTSLIGAKTGWALFHICPIDQTGKSRILVIFVMPWISNSLNS